MKPRIWKVHQLNAYLRALISDDMLLSSFAVEGELSNVRRHSSGHIYFTLKDSQAAISGIMFRGYAQGLTFEPKDGINALVVGYCSVFERTGQLQLYAENMEKCGQGQIHATFDSIKEKLANEGLFDANKKKPLPVAPNSVAVITSETGAVAHDIIKVATRRDPSVKLIFVPASVQGDNAAQEVADAIALINNTSLADVIIIARGGGSNEDLAAFNNEFLARSIASSAIPIVSAIGHETDVTIADFAADTRAPTPSAAAELTLPDRSSKAAAIANIKKSLDSLMDSKLSLAKLLLSVASESLVNLSPLNVITRGYALATDSSGAIKTDAWLFAVGETFNLKLRSGEIIARVSEVFVSKAEDLRN